MRSVVLTIFCWLIGGGATGHICSQSSDPFVIDRWDRLPWGVDGLSGVMQDFTTTPGQFAKSTPPTPAGPKQGEDLYVLAHEFGHNMGSHHVSVPSQPRLF